jgi:D-lactate dehydrogenase
MKIVIFELEDWEKGSFKELESGYHLILTSAAIAANLDSQFASAEIISASLSSDMSADSLRRFKKLKLISTRTTGFDHIDLAYCRENGIVVCNVPDYADRTVAEHVFALLLAISHQIVEASNRTRAGNFSLKGLIGFDLQGKALGVIGTGAIGRQVIEIALGFRMEVLAFDVRPDDTLASRMGFRYLGLDALLARADIISLHIPGSPKTHNLISKDQFRKMKKGMVLINTSPGDVVDIEAMLEALTEGTLAAAGLDVLPEEPAIREESELLRSIFTRKYNLEMLLADHVVSRLPNVIITPHSAFNTREAVERLLAATRRNIEAFIAGRPQNVVPLPQLAAVSGSARSATVPLSSGHAQP